MKKILFIGLLFVLAGTGVWSQEVSDSVRIHYRRGYRGVDPDYHNNRSELERFIRTLRREQESDRLERVVICSWTSPDGVTRYNELLAGRRADSLKSWLVRHAQIPGELVSVRGETNLLYDALLMPSLEAEYRFNDRWTVNLEGEIAWWKNDGKHKYYQLATISPEVRWWFGQQKNNPWHGHYLGLFGGFSWFDLENKENGYQGEAEIAGLSYGYMFPIARRLSLEAGLGLGYLHSKYEEYEPVPHMGGTHYVYLQTKRVDYFGPLKLKLALVWHLQDINRKKGGAQ